MAYPVEAVLPDLLNKLSENPNAVLSAPPGAGKTTLVAPALLDQPWCSGDILLLSPRRLAARMAAERIADLTGERLGEGVGYATRMDSKQSEKTRILVLTEGIFRNRIIADPELVGVSAVLFDEVHERSMDSDFGLALALESQAAFRPSLRLLAMSATLDGERFSRLMNDAPVIESEGKSWPLDIQYVGRRSEEPIEQDAARTVRGALRDEEGDILCFLPGVREIDRASEALESLPKQIIIHKLYGQIDPAEQRKAIRPDPQGRRKIILATNIAETSLTIDGVRIVVDSGLARRARFDRAADVTRLVTERASLSAATQRAGRAARQGAGVAIRLWEEAGNGGLPPFDPPEILESDLAPLLLDCAIWGENDPAKLRWLDNPPEAGLKEARKRLLALGAIDTAGGASVHGKALAKLPLPPAIGHMLLTADAMGIGQAAAEVAVLLSERGLGGRDIDIDRRLQNFRQEKGRRASTAKKLAARWAKLAATSADKATSGGVIASANIAGISTAIAYPDRVARRRDKGGEQWLGVGGRGYRLDPGSPLTSCEWLAVADVQGAASAARIMSAARIDQEEVELLFADRIETGSDVRFDRATGGVKAESWRRLGAISLAKGQDSDADEAAITATLLTGVRENGLDMLPWAKAALQLRERAVWAGLEVLSNAALLKSLDLWLAPTLLGKRRLRDVASGDLTHALLGLIGWDGQQQIDRLAPKEFVSPAGTRHQIDYAAEAGPTAELRVQALYGLDTHPAIGAERVPLVLSLTSPAGRPIQTTRDLPAFWRGSWRDVQKEMRGRYPKHHWPDDPATATPSLATKKRQGL
ncbi:MAG: ATP-dependent helicase HrpB [Sphingorhabdus sp.]